MRPDKRRALDLARKADAPHEQIESLDASVRAKTEHTFRVIRCLFGHLKVSNRDWQRTLRS